MTFLLPFSPPLSSARHPTIRPIPSTPHPFAAQWNLHTSLAPSSLMRLVCPLQRPSPGLSHQNVNFLAAVIILFSRLLSVTLTSPVASMRTGALGHHCVPRMSAEGGIKKKYITGWPSPTFPILLLLSHFIDGKVEFLSQVLLVYQWWDLDLHPSSLEPAPTTSPSSSASFSGGNCMRI